MMYKNYIFDLYGTLVDIRTNERKAYLWEKTAAFYGLQGAGYTAKEFKEAYLLYCKEEKERVKKETGAEHPEIELERVFLRLFQEKGIDADMNLAIYAGQMFRVISTNYVKVYDGVVDFLEQLKKQQKKVYLLSNAQYIFTKYEMDYLDITKYFDGIVISSKELCEKPDTAFYQIVLERYGLKKEESIMIGNDLITDIQGSAKAGLDSLYIHSNISPNHDMPCLAKYTVMDGDFRKVSPLILKEA